MREFDLVGFGALNYDRLYVVDELPKTGDEILIRKEEEEAGGSAANTIVGVARLGGRTGFIGITGNDHEGKRIIHSFKTDHVDLTAVSISQERTGTAIDFVNGRGERALSIFPGANDAFEITDNTIEYAKRAKFVHLSSFGDEKQFKEQILFVKRVKAADARIKISFSPGMFYSRMEIEKLNPILEKCFIVFLSESEIELLTKKDYKIGCNALHKMGVLIVAVTLGTKGCYISEMDANNIKYFFMATTPIAPEKKVVDTTGAGDAFAAGFLYGLIRNETLHTCAIYGNSLARESVTKYGARKGLVNSVNSFKSYQVSLLELLKKEKNLGVLKKEQTIKT